MLVSLLAVTSYAQKVKPEFVYGKYGLKNFETGQWVVKPVYNDARYLGSYEGRHYYGVRTEDNLWGFFRSDDFSKYHISPRFAAITWWAWRFPVVGVQVGGNWGVIELYTDQASYLVNCTYKEATMSMDEVGLRSWDGSYREVKLGPLFEKALEKAKSSLLLSDAEPSEKNPVVNCGLIPDWILMNPEKSETVSIKRYVPYFYLSKTNEDFNKNLMVLQLYRSVIGQTDPEEVMERLMNDKEIGDVKSLFVDFSPYNVN